MSNFNTQQVQDSLRKLGIEIMPLEKRSSEWQTVSSPLREDKNPSFSVNIYSSAWIDHGTGEKGDLVNLVMKLKGYTTAQAMDWIRKECELSENYFKTKYDRSSYNYCYSAFERDFHQLTQKVPSAKFLRGTSPTTEAASDDQILDELLDITPQERLEFGRHELIYTVKSYDLISKETLLKYKCGITEQYGEDWLKIPYPNGAQLYSRKDGQKKIRMIKGSQPSKAFFGIQNVSGKGTLLIAKSPREAMLLYERFNDVLDVISIVTGETGSVSNEQKEMLKRICKRIHTVKVIFDCDTSNAKKIAKDFAKVVAQVIPRQVNTQYVDVWEATDGECKDMNDFFKRSPDPEKAYKEILSKGININKKKPGPKDIISKKLDVNAAKPHPKIVYDHLPIALKKLTDLINEDYRRDVFLNACLPVIARHLINIEIPHNDCNYSPDIYTLVIAKPGSGKGVAEKARGIGKVLNQNLLETSKKEKAAWECLSKEERENTQTPPLKQLYLPGNSSSRALYDFMMNNNSRGLIFETEIDTLINASRQDWGDFTDIIRKAFHHEPISIQRKGDEMYIDRPQLSIFMSGTFDQFRKLFDSAENGHFSRYALYTFEAPLEWKTHRPTQESQNLDRLIGEFSKTLFAIYNTLKKRGAPLKIYLEEYHWDNIDRTFREKMSRLEQERMSRYLQSSNQRAAVVALRVAASLCIIRNATEVNINILGNEGLTITDSDLKAAIYLANNYLDHAIRLFQVLPSIGQNHTKGTKFESFYYRLPSNFETKQAYYIGIDLGVSKRTIRNYLQTLLQEGSLIKEEHGVYQKIDT